MGPKASFLLPLMQWTLHHFSLRSSSTWFLSFSRLQIQDLRVALGAGSVDQVGFTWKWDEHSCKRKWKRQCVAFKFAAWNAGAVPNHLNVFEPGHTKNFPMTHNVCFCCCNWIENVRAVVWNFDGVPFLKITQRPKNGPIPCCAWCGTPIENSHFKNFQPNIIFTVNHNAKTLEFNEKISKEILTGGSWTHNEWDKLSSASLAVKCQSETIVWEPAFPC